MASSQSTIYQWYFNGDSIPNAAAAYYVADTIGHYSVKVIDANGCQTIGDTTIHSIVRKPVANFTTSSATCADSCIDFKNVSQYATSYHWQFPGGTPSNDTAETPQVCYDMAGIYPVTLIASNMTGSDTLTIQNSVTVYTLPQPTISRNRDTLYTQPGYSAYQWYLNGNILNGETSAKLLAQIKGDYSVLVTNSNGCSKLSDLEEYMSIISIVNNNSLAIYPNPLSDGYWKLLVTEALIGGTIDVFDVNGKVVYSSIIFQKLSEIKLEGAKGLYLFRLNTKEGTFSKTLLRY